MNFIIKSLQIHRRHSEKGLSAAWFMAVLTVLMGLAGLAVDSGLMLSHYRLAQVTVDGAAYAAATELDRDVFEGGTNDVVLDASNACGTADTYAAENGKGVASIACSVSGPTVFINGTVTAPTLFMRIFGISQLTFHPSAAAELKYGITEEGQ
jgi:uncharacterized membrane protein